MQLIVYVLLNYINCSIKKDTNYYLARSLLLHLKEVPYCTLEEMAEICHVSDSTLHRFCQLIGYKNYKNLRKAVTKTEYQDYPQIHNHDEKKSYLQMMNENMIFIENLPLSLLDKTVNLIENASHIYLMGYGEFQYAALYFQKELYTHGKLIEIKTRTDISKSFFQSLKQNDLIIITSMHGQYLHLSLSKDFHDTIQKSACQKVLITQSEEAEWIYLFDLVLHCGKYSQYGLSKYAIMRLYERLIIRYHEQMGEVIYE